MLGWLVAAAGMSFVLGVYYERKRQEALKPEPSNEHWEYNADIGFCRLFDEERIS